MSTGSKVSAAEFDAMVLAGVFDSMEGQKIELIRGEIRSMSPAGPIHSDLIDYLTEWSVQHGVGGHHSTRVQSGFICDDNRPEPDVLWMRRRRYADGHPTAADVLLLIEVADSSVRGDLGEKAEIYAEAGWRNIG